MPGTGAVAVLALHPVESPGADDPGEPVLVPLRGVSRRMAPAAVVGDFFPGPEVHPVPALEVELVRSGPGSARRHEIALPVEEKGLPAETADDVGDIGSRQSQRKGDVPRFDGAGAMQDARVAGCDQCSKISR